MEKFDELMKNMAKNDTPPPPTKIEFSRLFAMIAAKQSRENDNEIVGWRKFSLMTSFAAAAMLFLAFILHFNEPLPTENDAWAANYYQGEIYYLDTIGEIVDVGDE